MKRAFLKLKLYILIAPWLIWCLGVCCNQLVEVTNHGMMPVVCNTHVCGPDIPPGTVLDGRHVTANGHQHLMFLADVWNMGNIYSVGDGFLALGSWLWDFAPLVWGLILCLKVLNAEHD